MASYMQQHDDLPRYEPARSSEGGLEQHLRNLDALLDELTAEVAELIQKLDPVLLPSSPEEPGPIPAQQSVTATADHVDALVRHVEALTCEVRQARGRVYL